MKEHKVLRSILAVVAGILITTLFSLLSIRGTIFTEPLLRYSIESSDYSEVLMAELLENFQETIRDYGLNELTIKDAMESFDFTGEIISYYNLRLQGIGTDVDTRAFTLYLEKALKDQQVSTISDEAWEVLKSEIFAQLTLAYNTPFLYSDLSNLLSTAQHYRKLLDYGIYVFLVFVAVTLVGLLLASSPKRLFCLSLALGIAAIGSFGLAGFFLVYRFSEPGGSISVLFNAFGKTVSLLMLFGALGLTYVLLMFLAFRLAKAIALKLGKMREKSAVKKDKA